MTKFTSDAGTAQTTMFFAAKICLGEMCLLQHYTWGDTDVILSTIMNASVL